MLDEEVVDWIIRVQVRFWRYNDLKRMYKPNTDKEAEKKERMCDSWSKHGLLCFLEKCRD